MKVQNGEVALLIVDDDPQICESLQGVTSAWGINAESITDPQKVIESIENSFYNVVLLDVVMPGKSGIDLIPEITEKCPETKIIIMTGYADKETAITALRHGAFDLLEKPVDFEFLSHSINRALDIQKTELDYKKALMDVEIKSNELQIHKQRLERTNRQLMETNNALSVLAQNIERTKQETERQVVLKTRSLIIPIIEKLMRDDKLLAYRTELTMLISHVEDLTSGMAYDIKIATTLTATELRVASLIKNGLTTEELANHLNISTSTVKTHRKNIRKKLNINKSQRNLKDFLKNKMGDGEGQSKRYDDDQFEDNSRFINAR